MEKEIISQLGIEHDSSGNFILTQDLGCGDTAIVGLDPLHVRRIIELARPIAELNPANDKHARTERALLRLSERIIRFRDEFADCADFDHADLSTEMVQLNALRVQAFDQLEDLGHQNLIESLREERQSELDSRAAPTPLPTPLKPAVAHSGKSANASKPVKTAPSLESDSVQAVRAAVSGTPAGITRPTLATSLAGTIGRSRVYEIVSGLVVDGRIQEVDGILSGVDVHRTHSDRTPDEEADDQPEVERNAMK
jgi:hypothetical protein